MRKEEFKEDSAIFKQITSLTVEAFDLGLPFPYVIFAQDRRGERGLLCTILYLVEPKKGLGRMRVRTGGPEDLRHLSGDDAWLVLQAADGTESTPERLWRPEPEPVQ